MDGAPGFFTRLLSPAAKKKRCKRNPLAALFVE
jgi:hypothetical protein